MEKADEVVFFLTAATDYNLAKLDVDREINPSEICQRILTRLDKDSYEKIKQIHVTEHSNLFNRVTFNMGEPSALPTNRRLEQVKNGEVDLSLVTLYFQYGRYLLMNSSRLPAYFRLICKEYGMKICMRLGVPIFTRISIFR